MAGSKGLLAFAFTLLLSNGIKAYKFEEPKCETAEEHYIMYPASDPRSFYVCLPDGNPRLVECDAGHVFVNDEQVYGCAPFSLWPCNKNVVPIDCSGADRDTLVRAQDPHNYWICAAPNGTPTELPCPDGKGFVKNSTHMGCISWDGWSC
ncbi:unnamed protein product [Hermetia illucens]|uniref:Chitin-binding type-2 domain-containing protein n=2 Tax=Hermetia illucens TaxID=343691 RepID=A0A7R8UAA3_HERIL|nr:unnamed protein product [Hermetia illucens]